MRDPVDALINRMFPAMCLKHRAEPRWRGPCVGPIVVVGAALCQGDGRRGTPYGYGVWRETGSTIEFCLEYDRGSERGTGSRPSSTGTPISRPPPASRGGCSSGSGVSAGRLRSARPCGRHRCRWLRQLPEREGSRRNLASGLARRVPGGAWPSGNRGDFGRRPETHSVVDGTMWGPGIVSSVESPSTCELEDECGTSTAGVALEPQRPILTRIFRLYHRYQGHPSPSRPL